MTPAGVPSCVGWQGACVYDLFQARLSRRIVHTRAALPSMPQQHSCGTVAAGPAGQDPPVHVRPRSPWARRALWPRALVARLRRAVTQTACVHRSARATAHALSRAKARFRAIRCADGDQQEAIEQLVYNGGQWPAGASFSGVRQASAIAHNTTGPLWSSQYSRSNNRSCGCLLSGAALVGSSYPMMLGRAVFEETVADRSRATRDPPVMLSRSAWAGTRLLGFPDRLSAAERMNQLWPQCRRWPRSERLRFALQALSDTAWQCGAALRD